MADLRTVRQLMADQLHVPNNSAFLDLLLRHISSAMRYLRSQRTYFNEADFEFDTVLDQANYTVGTASELPVDFLEVLDDQVWVKQNQVNNQRILVDPVSAPEYDRLLSSGPTTTATPTSYAIHNRQMLLWPTPDGVHTVYGRYLKDLGTIQFTFDGSSYAYTVGGSPISSTDTYTNAWMTDGRDALVNRACYEYANLDTHSSSRADSYLMRSIEALAEIAGQTQGRNSTGQIRPYL